MIPDFFGPDAKKDHRLDHEAMEKRGGEFSRYAIVERAHNSRLR